jgi:hypothetical protein
MGVSTSRRRRPGLLADVYHGAVWGEFTPDLGVPGALTLIVLAFVPVIGTLCALRDFLASWSHRDGTGALLNVLAVVPVLGGFSKTAEMLRHARLLTASVNHTRQRGSPASAFPGTVAAMQGHSAARRPTNPFALISVTVAVLCPFVAPELGLGLVAWLTPRLALDMLTQRLVLYAVILGVPLVAIVTGHLGVRRAARWKGYSLRGGLARVGLVLGYLYFIAFGVLVALFGLVRLPGS